MSLLSPAGMRTSHLGCPVGEHGCGNIETDDTIWGCPNCGTHGNMGIYQLLETFVEWETRPGHTINGTLQFRNGTIDPATLTFVSPTETFAFELTEHNVEQLADTLETRLAAETKGTA